MSRRPRRRPKKKKKPKGASMLTGIFIIALAIVAIIAIYQMNWIVGYIDGEKVGENTIEDADVGLPGERYKLLAVVTSISILIGGAIITISNLLEEIEVLDKTRSRWLNLGAEKGLAVLSLIIIFMGAKFLGLFISFTHKWMILFDSTLVLLFPVPFLLLGIGSIILVYVLRKSKKELDSIVFDHIKRNKKVKKVKKTPVREERRRF